MTGTVAPHESARFAHRPVMLDEVLGWLAPVPPGVVLDATVGGAGHASAILDRYPALTTRERYELFGAATAAVWLGG